MKYKARILLAALAVASFSLAACGDQNEQLDDAPVGQIDDAPVFVITNVDQFPNVAVRCYGANGIYTTTREAAGAITIVVNDPECPDYDPAVATVVSG